MAIGEEDVLRLHVAVHEILAMGVIERGAHVARDADRFRHRYPMVAQQPLAQRTVGHVRRDVIEQPAGLTRVDQRQDVGMGEARGDLDLPQEPLGAERCGQLGMQDLDGDSAAVLGILGEVHRRHTAPAELALDAVAAGERGGEVGGYGRHRAVEYARARARGGAVPARLKPH